MSVIGSPFQLLEINLTSAQDLAHVSKSIHSYAVAWINPERKLTTRIDQNGHTNPVWNEKFVFRVDDEFLNAENSALMIEIYASAWLRDVLIGTVAVLISNLLPPSARSGNRKSKQRFVALQIRRPSGRPQGILNIGVDLIDGTMRSMPIFSELSASGVGYWDTADAKKQTPNQTPQQHTKDNHGYTPMNSKLLVLPRSQSEKNDSTINDYTYNPGKLGSMCDGGGSSLINGGSEVGVPQKGRIINANGSLCSDVGPSPSVVAAAIAKGIYPLSYPMPQASGTVGSSILDDWSDNNSTEGLKTKIERWRTELPPIYDHHDLKKLKAKPNPNLIAKTPGRAGKTPGRAGKTPGRTGKTPGRTGKTPGRTPARPKKGNGLFSCFGTAYGCEFSITCGGGNRKKRYGNGKSRLSPSDLTYDESYL